MQIMADIDLEEYPWCPSKRVSLMLLRKFWSIKVLGIDREVPQILRPPILGCIFLDRKVVERWDFSIFQIVHLAQTAMVFNRQHRCFEAVWF